MGKRLLWGYDGKYSFPYMFRILGEWLGDGFYKAGTIQEIEALLNQEAFDAIMLEPVFLPATTQDLELEMIDYLTGFDIIRKLRQGKYSGGTVSDVPLVIFSSNIKTAKGIMKRERLENSKTRYLQMPKSSQEILSVLKEVIGS